MNKLLIIGCFILGILYIRNRGIIDRYEYYLMELE